MATSLPCFVLLASLFLVLGPRPSLGVKCYVCGGPVMKKVFDEAVERKKAEDKAVQRDFELDFNSDFFSAAPATLPDPQKTYNERWGEPCEKVMDDKALRAKHLIDCAKIDSKLNRCVRGVLEDQTHGRICQSEDAAKGFFQDVNVVVCSSDNCNLRNFKKYRHRREPAPAPVPAPADGPPPPVAAPEPKEDDITRQLAPTVLEEDITDAAERNKLVDEEDNNKGDFTVTKGIPWKSKLGDLEKQGITGFPTGNGTKNAADFGPRGKGTLLLLGTGLTTILPFLLFNH